MKKVMMEFSGMTDLVVQLQGLAKTEFKIDLDTVGGTGGLNYTYYFTAVDSKGNLEDFTCVTRLEFVKKLEEIIKAGWVVDIPTLGASAGRGRYFWFECEVSEEEEVEVLPDVSTLILEEGLDEEKNTPLEEPKPVDATDSAFKLAEVEGLDLSEVKGSGKEGRITKQDVVNFLETKKA